MKFQEWSEHLGANIPTSVIRLTFHYQQGHPTPNNYIIVVD